ncbi:MAG: leucine-rich repeat domain-containing protein [Clostridiales bacterium]|nr:leucine-rich repeat domain-containing protein [Clostridiales bacterium]
MKKIKNIIAVITSVVMLAVSFSVLSLTAASENSDGDYQVGDIVQFGSYPQSLVTDEDTISSLNGIDADWVGYGYYSGTGDYGSMSQRSQNSDYMYYCDVTFEGVKYRGVYFSEYRPYYTFREAGEDNSLIDDNGYSAFTYYWFEYEPLRWLVLDPDEGFLVCVDIIDAQAYQNLVYRAGIWSTSSSNTASIKYSYYTDSDYSFYVNNYAESSIRAWLNDDFYNAAFSEEEQSVIFDTAVTNRACDTCYAEYDSENTSDKVFLLSYEEALNSDYGFSEDGTAADSSKRSSPTDYAKAQGIHIYGDNEDNINPNLIGKSLTLLRTASFDSNYICMIYYDGSVDNYIGYAYDCSLGVRPALKLDLQSGCVETPTEEQSTDDAAEESTTAKEEETTEKDASSEDNKNIDWYSDASLLTYTISDGEVTIETCDTSVSGYYAIPDTIEGYLVTRVGDYAFVLCSELKGVKIPDGVTSMGAGVFTECAALETVEIAGSVLTVGEYAFDGCSALSRVVLEEGVAAIGDGAFSFCSSLENIDLPDSLTVIGMFAFEGTALTSITVPAGVTSIGIYALGYGYDGDFTAVDGFTVYGYAGTAAEAYANDNGIMFAALEENTTAEPAANEPTTAEPATNEPTTAEPVTSPSTTEPTSVSGLTVSEEIAVIDEEAKLITVNPKVSVKEFCEAASENIAVIDAENNEMSKDDVIGTGCKVQLLADGEAAAEYEVLVPMDVDGNGRIAAADARLALRASAKLDTLEGVYFTAADTDGDLAVKPADARAILRSAAKLS